MHSFPRIGHGVGLRTEHYRDVLGGAPQVDWFEVITENFLVAGGNPRRVLRQVRERWPVVLHGVSLSIGGPDPLDEAHLSGLSRLAREIEPAWISDHLCWSGYNQHRAHDLWPLPYTEEALDHVVRRISQVQERVGRRILIENVSSYVEFASSSMPEWEFLAEVAKRADCGILLDVNNIFVSAHNHRFDALTYLNAIPVDRVGQFHLAGHSDHGTHLLDTHDHPVRDEVWELYRAAVRRFGNVPALIEWDDELPTLERLVEESQRARTIEREVLSSLEAA